MKPLRVFLLVLLTALLPMRGVVAAAMLCPAGHHGTVSPHDAVHGDEDHHDHDGGAHADSCNLCASCCAMNLLPSATPAFEPPAAFAAADFGELAAPAADFHSGGPDRPPRSI
ncbi:MAG TPA: DUF2946 family protein [Albitalea sp.]|nr:DUF2946 family protein [Albitalea sp.]